MNYGDFITLVRGMRKAQKRYFADRRTVDLQEARRLEAEMDHLLEVGPAQPTLFEAGEYDDES